MLDAGYAGCELWLGGCMLRVTGCELRFSGMIKAQGIRVQGSRISSIYKIRNLKSKIKYLFCHLTSEPRPLTSEFSNDAHL